jgi:hypothetical protein
MRRGPPARRCYSGSDCWLGRISRSGSPTARTAGRYRIGSSRVPEDAELADGVDRLGEDETDEDGKPVNAIDGKPKRIPPIALTVKNVVGVVGEDFEKWLTDRKNSRQISHRFVTCGYMRLPPRERWVVAGFRRPTSHLCPGHPRACRADARRGASGQERQGAHAFSSK